MANKHDVLKVLETKYLDQKRELRDEFEQMIKNVRSLMATIEQDSKKEFSVNLIIESTPVRVFRNSDRSSLQLECTGATYRKLSKKYDELIKNQDESLLVLWRKVKGIKEKIMLYGIDADLLKMISEIDMKLK